MECLKIKNSYGNQVFTHESNFSIESPMRNWYAIKQMNEIKPINSKDYN